MKLWRRSSRLFYKKMQNELCLIQTYIIFLKLIYLYVEQFRVFWLAITAPVKQSRSEAEWMSRVRRRSTESATGCEAAGNLPDKIGNNTVYYNGADSDYQPDAYGNTRKEKWNKTGFEMSYDYDKLNRLTSVTTPDGKKETYSYNQNSQVTAIGGIISGTISYKDSKLETVTLNNGLKKTLSYNEAGLISGISYSSDKNTSLKTGFEYLYDKNFNITQRTHKDTQNTDKFTYDGLNRLVTSKLKGKFTNDTYEKLEAANMDEIDYDLDGMTNVSSLSGFLFPADKVTLDEKGKSLVYDFTEEKEIQKIELFKTNLERKSRIRERDLHIYTKQNETDGWSELTKDNWDYVVDSGNQSIHLNLKNTLNTRFIKIRTIWDDRDVDNQNVSDYVTFTNESVQKMIRIWTLENHRGENYVYDKNSNRTGITENGITGKNILNVLQKNSNDTFGKGGIVGTDGGLESIWGLGYYMGKELGTKQYITAGDEKIIPPNILVNISVGAIFGLQRNESGQDDHYVYRNWSVTIDPMDHTRSAASEYTDYSCRPLFWANY